MNDKKSSYQQIMKATSVFGGVQVFNIIISIIRSKVVAVLLGPAGMGIMGLLTTTLSLVSSATNFGLSSSAVRDISESNNSNNEEKISETISVFRKLVWLTGLLGMLVTIILSPLLSKLTFGNYDYSLAFIALSTTLLINQLGVGQRVLLQGLRKISWLAKAGIYSSFFGLIITLPLYYLYNEKGIVPAIIITSIIVLIIQYIFSRKINIKTQFISFQHALRKGNGMLKLGFILSISGLVSASTSYLIRIFISHFGSLSDVGFYNAGFAIINTYVGLIFSAMITDYYPRLAAVNKDNSKCNELINQQIEISIYILSPLICIFLIFINWIIIFLYSTKFLPITDMIHWAIMGIYFQALSWAIGVIIMAKGNAKYFFWNELIANIYLLILNILGYYFLGLKGLGISFLLGYVLHFIQIYFFANIKYNFKLEKNIFKLFLFNLFIGIICFIVAFSFSEKFSYLFGTIILIGITVFSFYNLNRKIGIIEIIKNKIRKK